jgi:molybdopterin-containing oxidoreductase family iron-sulfur binding subunit
MSAKYDNIILGEPAGEQPPIRNVNRRDFLKAAGFTFGAALIAGCKPAKVEKAIPFLVKPEEVTPGVATWYATTCGGCPAGCGLMVKNRDGRPIKLEGIPDHPVSGGGLCPVGQAHLLGLYDSQRLLKPIIRGRESTLENADREIQSHLLSIKNSGGVLRLVTGTITSPTTRKMIADFLAQYSNAKHIEYDTLSVSATLDAHLKTHGKRILPRYHFDRAELIVSFEADFLGTWISPVEFTAGYRKGRTLAGTPPRFSRHIQYESGVSLTGSNADIRVAMTPGEIRKSLLHLAAAIARLAQESFILQGEISSEMNLLAETLWNHKRTSLVLCGVNDIRCQVLTNYVNHLLGNYGSTVDADSPSFQFQGNDIALEELRGELKSGSIDGIILSGVNPVYDLPWGNEISAYIRNARFSVCIADRNNETSEVSQYVLSEPHALESWNDAEPVAGCFTLSQPVIQQFGSGRMLAENLSVWIGNSIPVYDLIRDYWQQHIFPKQNTLSVFQSFWDQAVYNGFVCLESVPESQAKFNNTVIAEFTKTPEVVSDGPDVSLVVHPTIALMDGRHAHNPWLQELPDPVTKIVWDNYVSLSKTTADRFSVSQGDVLRIEKNGSALELPVHIQPGLHDQVISIPLGYGRKGTERFAGIGPRWIEAKPTVEEGMLVGKNAAEFIRLIDGYRSYDSGQVVITKTGRRHELACTQEHHSLYLPVDLDPTHGERRPIVQQTSFSAFVNNPSSGSFEKQPQETLWPEEHTYKGHHWGMVIDLTACTGCSACVISCQAENNIPCVGKDEVYRNRELTWIRIDRYYEEHEEGMTASHQPMFCQHCGNAPCETVCPVLATVHSEEGLNQQVYNRCVGTRYCSNNCPYKVRRFNWFDYDHGDDMHRLVLNPDITVRERGVMEKCSLCVQRIQEAKIEAKKRGIPVQDGEIQTACAQSCPANAIIFGDMNDTNSRLSQQLKNPRYYRVLEDLGVRPSVGYMTQVRNKDERGETEHV